MSVGDLEQQAARLPTGWARAGASLRSRDHVEGRVQTHVAAQGFTALDLQTVYKIPATLATTTTPTIAIIDAYGYASLEADLAVYRSISTACRHARVAERHLTIVNQTGQASPLPGAPLTADDWTIEFALDVDIASAAYPKSVQSCSSCKRPERPGSDVACSSSENVAAAMGATVISSSWGGPEQAGVLGFRTWSRTSIIRGSRRSWQRATPATTTRARGGDYPDTSTHVIAVDGTHVVKDTSSARGYTETAWKLGGSGCGPTADSQAGVSDRPPDARSRQRPTSPRSAIRERAYRGLQRGETAAGLSSAARVHAPLVAGIFAVTGNGGATSKASSRRTTRRSWYGVRHERNERHVHECDPVHRG